MFVLRLKGIKRTFSQAPIDYVKVRKEDIKRPNLKKGTYRQFNSGNSTITEINAYAEQNRLVIFCHGGAFISGPVLHHWNAAKRMGKQLKAKVWLVDYPKAPEHSIRVMSHEIDKVYELAQEKYAANQIILIGDSVGGTLITALVQRLIFKGKQLPEKLVLISPVMEAAMVNEEIAEIEPLDPMLGIAGVKSAKEMAALNGNLTDPIISPLNGRFKGFPPTLLCIADHDITMPDQWRAADKMKAANVKLTIIKGDNMPHIWPILPVLAEGKKAFAEMIKWMK